MVAGSVYLFLIYFYLKLPFDFSLSSLFFIGFIPILFNIFQFKPVSKKPFLSIFWIILFISLFLNYLLKNHESLSVIYRAIIFCPFLLVAAFLPFKTKQLGILTVLQIGLYIFLNRNIADEVFYQELFFFSLLISIFFLNNYTSHKTLKPGFTFKMKRETLTSA